MVALRKKAREALLVGAPAGSSPSQAPSDSRPAPTKSWVFKAAPGSRALARSDENLPAPRKSSQFPCAGAFSLPFLGLP